MAQTTFAVPSTDDYTDSVTGYRHRFFAGDYVPLETAVRFGMSGASLPAAPVPFTDEERAYLLASFEGEADLGAAYAPIAAKYIVQTAHASLTAEQALGALGTGILKNTTTTGVLSIAVGADLPAHTHASVAATDLVPNGRFETNITGWVENNATVTLTRETGSPVWGTGSLKVETDASALASVSSGAIAVTPGQLLFVSFYVDQVSGDPATLHVQALYDEASANRFLTSVAMTTTRKQHTALFLAPPVADNLYLEFMRVEAAVAAFLLDEIRMAVVGTIA